MRTSLVAGIAMLLLAATPAHAHRLDEYLQATMISVGRDRVQLQLRLTPGVAVFPTLREIDTNLDGVISDAEQRAYAERVLRDLSLAIDGTHLPLRVTALKFASVAEMKEGRGDIEIDLDAVVPRGGKDRRLTFENRHLKGISVYLVNALVSRDPDIRVSHQNRNYEQSFYQMDYAQAGTLPAAQSRAWWSGAWGWLAVAAFLSLAKLALLARRSYVRFMPRIPPFTTPS